MCSMWVYLDKSRQQGSYEAHQIAHSEHYDPKIVHNTEIQNICGRKYFKSSISSKIKKKKRCTIQNDS